MNRCFARNRVAALLSGFALALVGGHVWSAGFALQENSGSGLGNAFAGGAASAEDASTVWFNPAGMSRFGTPQLAVALHGIGLSAKFRNEGSAAAAQQPLGGEGGDAGDWAAVPNLYAVWPLTRQWAVGLGINAPFGLKTEYDETWIGRYQAVKSDVMTYNVNPSISYRFNNVSLAAGVDYQHIKATFTSKVNYSGGLAQAAQIAAQGGQIPATVVPPFLGATTGLDANADIHGDDNAWGWNVGALWEMDQNGRLGAQYRSAIKYTISGSVEFTTPSAPALPASLAPVYVALSNAVNAQLVNSDVSTKVKLPPIANVSYFRTLNDRWDIMGDVQWTGWSTIEDLTFVRANGTILASTPEHFRDTWRFSAGANYRLDDRWMLRGGLAWEQSPVRDEFRTPRLPDSDRTWISLGAQYKPAPQWKLDLGASYIYVSSGSIDKTGEPPSIPTYGHINGSYDNYVVIVSGQISYAF